MYAEKQYETKRIGTRATNQTNMNEIKIERNFNENERMRKLKKQYNEN